MPGFTTPDGFIHEVRGDQPLISLTGGDSGTFPILAEQVQTKFTALEGGTIADMEARLQVVEAAVAATRWRHIDSGSETSSFTITVPSGYQRLRLTMVGDADGTTYIRVRVNNDTTAGRHRYGRVAVNAAGTVQVPNYADTTSWGPVEWATVESNTLVMDIIPSDAAAPSGAANPAFQAFGHRDSTSDSTHRAWFSWGKFQEDAIISSLVVFCETGDFVACRWWLEGYIAP